jgi:hypothetical protein
MLQEVLKDNDFLQVIYFSKEISGIFQELQKIERLRCLNNCIIKPVKMQGSI